ncbi:MAG: tRNA lysidine(34) synthetase TilS [Oscillospiraceae bacterium]|nr:tRNA lysidine(34) synthetase TilS [Oscillospiraceae bacterium]
MAIEPLDLSEAAAGTVERYAMLSQGSAVLVGFSGGADSTALLHWLCSVREAYGLRVAAAHLNHGLRGAESDADEAFCRELCQRWNVPLQVRRADIQGPGIEEAGRRARYDFFAACVKNANPSTNPSTNPSANPSANTRVALAHTLSDKIETFLFHFGRGAALRGLCSIPPVRDIYIRPLIEVSRAQVEAYCAAHGLSYREDSTNEDTGCRRNLIRHTLVPPLKEAFPSLEAAALRGFRAIEADEAYLGTLAEKLYDQAMIAREAWSRPVLLCAEPVLRSRALRRIIAEAGGEPSHRRLEVLERALQEGGALNITDDIRVRARGKKVSIERKSPKRPRRS